MSLEDVYAHWPVGLLVRIDDLCQLIASTDLLLEMFNHSEALSSQFCSQTLTSKLTPTGWLGR